MRSGFEIGQTRGGTAGFLSYRLVDRQASLDLLTRPNEQLLLHPMPYPIPSDPLIPPLHPWCQGFKAASHCVFSNSRNSESEHIMITGGSFQIQRRIKYSTC